MSINKTFSVKRENKPGVHVTGFPGDNGRDFVTVTFGDSSHSGEFSVLLYMADACALQIALGNAINHANPRAVEAVDLALLDEAVDLALLDEAVDLALLDEVA